MLDEDFEYKCIPNDDGKWILDYKDCSDLTVSTCYEFNSCYLNEHGNKFIEYENDIENKSGNNSKSNSNIINLSTYGLNILILLIFKYYKKIYHN